MCNGRWRPTCWAYGLLKRPNEPFSRSHSLPPPFAFSDPLYHLRGYSDEYTPINSSLCHTHIVSRWNCVCINSTVLFSSSSLHHSHNSHSTFCFAFTFVGESHLVVEFFDIPVVSQGAPSPWVLSLFISTLFHFLISFHHSVITVLCQPVINGPAVNMACVGGCMCVCVSEREMDIYDLIFSFLN